MQKYPIKLARNKPHLLYLQFNTPVRIIQRKCTSAGKARDQIVISFGTYLTAVQTTNRHFHRQHRYYFFYS